MTGRSQKLVDGLLLVGFWVFLILGTDSKSRWSVPFMVGAGLCAVVMLVRFVRQTLRPRSKE